MKNPSLSLMLLITSIFLIGCTSKVEPKKAGRIPESWSFDLRTYGPQGNPLQIISMESDWDSAYYINPKVNIDPLNSYPYSRQFRIPFFLSPQERDSVYSIIKRIKCRKRNYDNERIEKYTLGYAEFNFNAPVIEEYFECSYYGTEKMLKANQNMEALLKFFNAKIKGKLNGRALLE
ncbi:hypothetical protein [Adhaeribacter terreus]|uniref:Lipoprotein n=1 Tax=Adhaeribacter terreus TaxID=529703 RepID=A0ABW0EE15_9BACT